MPIKYALFENNITADPDDYAAMVRVGWASRPPARADGDDLVQDIVDQGSTVNKPDILAVTAALKLACRRPGDQRHVGPRTAYRTFGRDADGPADVGQAGNDAARAMKSEPRTSVSGWI